ncbi:hypothetical protein GONAM_55_00470 [Gordonia namibiensis NBRC 108229]|uniref:DUF1697 domain-containing protein n=1 Tax=Gordonia namibiensis NBRC 108229 TaxID=1208314 RepID=K6X8W8_9ACTN|nr:DUF1697 domain-containing protein [Gordonia namibiensis]GAC02522.1 hypothetical protein GONAM_55_00470 [Gordonia namibiensis NBRC 108229]
MSSKAAVRIVLIRAINVGGAKLPMAELREIATELGATDVSTYIASGNLLCSPPGDPAEFDRALEREIEKRYGFFREIISRTPGEVQAALDAHPFEVADDRYSYVYFLTDEPDADKAAAFEEKDFGDDVRRVIGSDLHIRYADGAGRSKLTAPAIARGLGVQGTGRNLRTVRKLLDLTKD